MKYKTYTKYKPSGMEWINEIPLNWSLLKIRNVGILNTSSVDKKILPTELPVKLVNYMDVYSSKDKRIIDKPDFMKVTAKPQQLKSNNLIIGDILFTPSSETADDIGHSAVVCENILNGVHSYHLIRLRFNTNFEISDSFKRYAFNNDYVLNQLSSKCTGTTRMILGLHSFRETYFILPTVDEQQKIADFLDKKTLQIDNLIKKDKQLIKLLKERRIALINKAVTKGLDDKARLVDSGVDWIGEIPEGWEVMRLKRLLSYEQPGDYIANEIEKNKNLLNLIPVLTANKGFVIGYTEDKNGVYNKCLPVIIFDDFTTDKKYVDFPFKVRSSALKILYLTKPNTTNIRYLYFFMQALKFPVAEHNRHWISMYSQAKIPCPSIKEQNMIAQYLDEISYKTDNIIKKIESHINFLNEYKKSLIYNAVTGKIKV